MADYLKKTKMHKLGTVLGYPVSSLKSCSYKFYRGSEWLCSNFTLTSDSYCELKIYHNYGSYVSITSYEFNSETDEQLNYFRDFIDGDKYIKILV